MQKIENPAGGGGASGSVHVDELNDQKSTLGTEKTQALTPIQQRILVLLPTVDPATLKTRETLTIARDVALTRVADWGDWPPNLQSVHALAAFWCGRTALSPWPQNDLEKTIEAARHLLTGTLILRRLGDEHGDV